MWIKPEQRQWKPAYVGATNLAAQTASFPTFDAGSLERMWMFLFVTVFAARRKSEAVSETFSLFFFLSFDF